jgi:GxxExxY protein
MTENQISGLILDICFKVHKTLGPGLLESAYKECIYFELMRNQILVEKEKPQPLIYDQIKLECGYRIDLLVEKKVLIEVKSVQELNDVHLAQVLTYLRLGNYKLGMLINFNVAYLKDGIRRVVNGL